MPPVPEIRIRHANRADVRPDGEYVLYWMIAARRLAWSFALDRVFEPLRAGYPWASDRFHRFVLDGMALVR